MSTNLTSFRLPFTMSKDIHPDVVAACRYLFNGNVDLNQAIVALNSKVEANTTAIAAVPTATTTTTTSGGSTGGSAGSVNDQTGNTSYILQQSDFGGIIVINTASAFALTLNSSVTTPFYCVIENFGTGTVTLTPDSVSVIINTAASTTLPSGQSALLFWNSPTEWWMTTLPPMAPIPLVGTTGAIGGAPLTLGQTVTGTAAVAGSTTAMAVVASPVTNPGAGFVWDAYVSVAGTVTVVVTCISAGSPASSAYNIRVIP
jgi:hypothetical protein